MSDTITLTLSRADAARLRGGVCACHSVYEDETITRLLGLIDAALAAAPAEGPERAATGELEGLIAECERHDWRWRLERVCVEDGPDSCVLTRIASVNPLAWQGERFDDTDEDGWFGLIDTDADGSLTDLLRETMQWANERTNPHARVNLGAAIGGGGE